MSFCGSCVKKLNSLRPYFPFTKQPSVSAALFWETKEFSVESVCNFADGHSLRGRICLSECGGVSTVQLSYCAVAHFFVCRRRIKFYYWSRESMTQWESEREKAPFLGSLSITLGFVCMEWPRIQQTRCDKNKTQRASTFQIALAATAKQFVPKAVRSLYETQQQLGTPPLASKLIHPGTLECARW